MLFTALVLFCTANVYALAKVLDIGLLLPALACAVLFIAVNIRPVFGSLPVKKHQRIRCGTALLEAFLIAAALSVIFLFLGIFALELGKKTMIINSVAAFLILALAFWNGIIRIYISASQLGVKWRAIGAVCGLIPVVHLFVLIKLISLAEREYRFEDEKHRINEERSSEQICATRYPLLLVHGVFFRDFEHMNYWGRIPAELQKNGAQIFYGGQQSAQSVAKSAQELHERITQVLAETGAEKVNIIAHSKGGLDSRYAIGLLGADMRVASLTTINSPHHGCAWAQNALEKIPASVQEWIARRYESIFSILGDTAPAFLEGVRDLTPEACKRLNSLCPLPQQIPVHCVMSEMNHINSAPFPLWVSYLAMKLYDRNVRGDGLVPIESAKLDGAVFTMVPKTKYRGISHGDMIDLSRENIRGFDVREFYVHLVQDLKKQGL